MGAHSAAQLLAERLKVVEAERDQLRTAMSLLRSHRDAAVEAERKDAAKALAALAGAHIPTPEETYGNNASWAVSDLCRAVTKLYGDLNRARKALGNARDALFRAALNPCLRCLN